VDGRGGAPGGWRRGYWIYSEHQRSKAEQVRVQAEAAKQAAVEREAKAVAERVAAEEAQRRAQVERQALESARREMQATAARAVAEAERKKTPAAGAQVAVATPPTAARATGPDGIYAGPICYGPGRNDPPRCFRREATLTNGKISARWPGRDPGVTMVMDGDVSPSGEVTIHMHTENASGVQQRLELAGTLRDGRLDASGSFRNGRTATLNWRKSEPNSVRPGAPRTSP